VHIFLGITGASGAPYAARLLEALVGAGCQVGLSASDAGIEVAATELYGDRTLGRQEVLRRLVGDAGDAVRVWEPRDWSAPYASGSARVDGYVVCPCSMSTLGTAAAGAMANLVQRAISVALKEERKLVLMPRETPLSAIHLEGMLKLRQAGATILFLAPGFYHGWERPEQLIDFMVGRCLDQLGVENALVPEWGSP
jgi:flavin prenyltransferase